MRGNLSRFSVRACNIEAYPFRDRTGAEGFYFKNNGKPPSVILFKSRRRIYECLEAARKYSRQEAHGQAGCWYGVLD